jgi:ribose transport system substrate-binding protein
MAKKLKILVSLPTRDNDFQLEQGKSAERAARIQDVEVELCYANNDGVNQSTQILKSLQSSARPDGIVLESVGANALPQVARAARDAGIGWAVLNKVPGYLAELRSDPKVPIFAVTSDHVEIGRIQGRQFAALLPRGGSVLYIEGPSQSASAADRTAGMLESKPQNIRVTSLKGQWTEESALRTVRSWLSLATSQKVEMDLVAAQDDSMAMGARKAFEEIPDRMRRDLWLNLPFTGCDGVPDTGQTWVRDGLLAATIHIPPLAGQAVDILVKGIRTGIQPPVSTVTISVSIPPLPTLASRKKS